MNRVQVALIVLWMLGQGLLVLLITALPQIDQFTRWVRSWRLDVLNQGDAAFVLYIAGSLCFVAGSVLSIVLRHVK